MSEPFFSVLIPVFNVEKYLESCLESVLRQTFSDYEIILVDDGSQDSSGQICDDYAVRYPDIIRVQHKKNQGLVSARRAGLRLAAGQYICFLDSDDCWIDSTLSRLHEIIETTNTDVVLFRWSRIDESGKELNETVPPLFSQSGPIDKKTVFERMLSSSRINSLCLKCCKSALFDVDTDYSHYYSIRNGEDLIQSLPVLYEANTFYYLDEPLYQYRVNTASITHVYQKGQHRTMNILRPLLFAYIVKMGMDTPQNRIAFFKMYLGILWNNVEAMYSGIPSEEERNTALDELHSYEFVIKGKEYLGACVLPIQERLGLSVFYRNNNREMNAYMRLYLPTIKALRGAKAALRKFVK